MPDPLHILLVPPHKTAYKRITRSRISEYWSSKLSTATTMPSLAPLRTPSLRLSSGPHPIWTTCLSPHQVRIATIQAKMLAVTYRPATREQVPVCSLTVESILETLPTSSPPVLSFTKPSSNTPARQKPSWEHTHSSGPSTLGSSLSLPAKLYSSSWIPLLIQLSSVSPLPSPMLLFPSSSTHLSS